MGWGETQRVELISDRYNTFYVLYPLGISSECWLVYSSVPAAAAWHPTLPYLLYAILAIYVPGTFAGRYYTT